MTASGPNRFPASSPSVGLVSHCPSLLDSTQAAAVWLIVEFDGQYTEGVISPTRIHALAGIDDQNTLIDISIENSSRFFVYQLIRDDVEPENGSEDPDDETTNDAPADEEETDEEPVSQLDRARNWIKLSIGLLILIELLVAFVGINPWFRTIGFLAVLVAFIIVLPLSFIGDNPNFASPGRVQTRRLRKTMRRKVVTLFMRRLVSTWDYVSEVSK